MLRRRLLTHQLALDAIMTVARKKCSLDEALNSLSWNRSYFENIFQISQLLLKSELLQEHDLRLALDICLKKTLPILNVLVRRNSLSDLDANTVLSMHEQVVRGECTLEQAASRLRHDRASRGQDSRNLSEVNKPLRLGEILIAADLVTAADLIGAVEKGRSENVRFGQILIREFSLSEDVLQHALFCPRADQ